MLCKFFSISSLHTSKLNGLSSEDKTEVLIKYQTVKEESALPSFPYDRKINTKVTKENKEGYLLFREEYNTGIKDPIKFYTLLCYAFNNQIRFNSKGEYNMPFGKDRSSFNPTLRQKFIDFHKRLNEIDCSFLNIPFERFDFSDFTEGDFVYADPPYFNSVATYNENGGWTEEMENKLLETLDTLNDKGVKFALSNNLKYNNPLLDKWKDKYIVHYLKHDYSNCNYQKKDKSADCEVLITNY